MKKNIYYFNSLLRIYNKYRRKLDNLRKTNRNVRRQGILEKHIERLFEKLNLLNANIKQKTVATTFALSAFAFVPQTTDAQIGFKPVQVNPFGIVPVPNSYSSPALADLDNDGDLDLLTGDLYGSFYYQQNNGTATNPVFNAPQTNPFGLTSVGTYTYYSAPTFVDLDNDGDLDVISTEYYGDIKYYQNIGTASSPSFTTPVTNPFSLTNIGSSTLSHPTFADIDNDGDLDMMVGNSYGEVVYFQNIGNATTPNFALLQTNPFSISPTGSWTTPTFVDINNDNDFDLFIGDGSGNAKYHENTGTTSAANFAVEQINPFGLTQIGSYNKMTFKDLNGDGIIDMLAGDTNGDFSFFGGCATSSSTISPVSACSYISPSGIFKTTGGTFTDIIPNAAGCDSIITINLTINPVLNQTVTATNSFICGGSGQTTIQLNSSQNGVNYYLRDNSNNTIITGPIPGTGSSLSLNTGTISNTTTYNVYAEKLSPSNGLFFDGANASDPRVDCGNAASVQLSGNQISLEAWIYPTSWQNINSGHIINKEFNGGIGNDLGYMIRCGSGGDISFNLGNGNWNELVTTTQPLTLNTWQHVAATYDGTTMKIYVNGNLVASNNVSINFSAPNNNLTIGAWAGGNGSVFSGRIDEARVWSITKSQSEIQANMNTCLSGSLTGLTAYYQFENGAGSSILTDSSPNGNDGTIQNASWVAGQTICSSCNLQMAPVITVTVSSLPSATITTSTTNTLLCSGQTATLTASGANTYTWSTSQNNNSISVSPTVTTTYTVSGTDANGCSNSNTITQNVSLCTAINSIEDQPSSITLYPNPTNSILYIEIPQNLLGQKLVLTNALGQVLEAKVIDTTLVNYNLEEIPNGFYFIQVQTKNGIISKKIIKN